MTFIKNKGFVAYLIVAIMTIITIMVYISNVSTAYYDDMNSSIMAMMVCAIALTVAILVLPQIAKGKIVNLVVDIFRIGLAVLIILSGAEFISMRLESLGYIFNSNLELGNEAAFSAGSQAITGIILFVVTWIISLIASFFKMEKKAYSKE